MNESSVNQENTMYQKKVDFFQRVIPSINSRIGRELKDHELKAVAFAVDELYQGLEGMTADQFLQGELGVKPEDNPRDASMHIYKSIYDAKKTRLSREKEVSWSDPDRLKSFNAIGELMESGYNNMVEIYRREENLTTIGGVMEEWVPKWLTSPQAK